MPSPGEAGVRNAWRVEVDLGLKSSHLQIWVLPIARLPLGIPGPLGAGLARAGPASGPIVLDLGLF